MVRSEDDEEELRDIDLHPDASTIEYDLSRMREMTPMELYAAERRAGLLSVEAVDRFNKRIEELRQEGIAQGGTHCCGTTGKWHNPWCWTGQTKPESTET